MNTLYYGDNLDILKRYIKDETVDLIYLDPPFKSNQDYNVLFAEQDGTQSSAQIKAFGDTWHWDQSAAQAYQEIVESGSEKVSQVMQAFHTFLGGNDMMAYLSMMAPRLVELRRVLKPTGSIYLHCDPTASHYLKLLMDAVFGPTNFKNEFIWKRTSAHSDSSTAGNTHDIVLFYTNTNKFIWNNQYQPYDESYIKSHYNKVDEKGRKYRTDNLTAMGLSGGGYTYEWNGVTKLWRVPENKMKELHEQKRIRYTKSGTAEYIRFLDEMPGIPLQDIWDDIPPVNSQAQERLGYQTQKPEALLERIINASSNEGDVVLDPFCGCGTTIAVSQKLNRQWVGIDITHLAISLLKHRIHSTFGDTIMVDGKQVPAVEYKVIGEPEDLSGAEALAHDDPYQFQWWALGLVGARPVDQKKGADKGIDGRIYFHDAAQSKTRQIIFSVKGGHTSVKDVRDLRGVLDREKAEIGVLICLQEPTQPMKTEAADAGFYSPDSKNKFSKLQILTIEDLLNSKKIEYPRYMEDLTLKKAPRVYKTDSKNQDLPFEKEE